MARAWMIAISVLFASTRALGQPADSADTATGAAAQLFDEGRALAKRSDYEGACKRFEQAYKIDRGTGIEVNLADCHEHLGHLAEAWRLFDDAAERAGLQGNTTRARFARERADALAPRVATLAVNLAKPQPAGLVVTVGGHATPIDSAISVKVDPGRVEIVAAAAGYQTFTTTATTTAGATAAIDIPQLAPVRDTTLVRRRSRVILAIGLGAGAVATTFVSLAFGAVARNDYNRTVDDPASCPMRDPLTCTSSGLAKIDHARTLANVSTAFALGAVALGAAAAIVYVTAPLEHVAVAPTAGGVSLAMTGRF